MITVKASPESGGLKGWSRLHSLRLTGLDGVRPRGDPSRLRRRDQDDR